MSPEVRIMARGSTHVPNEQATARETLAGLLADYPGYLQIPVGVPDPAAGVLESHDVRRFLAATVVSIEDNDNGTVTAYADGNHKMNGFPLAVLTRCTEHQRAANPLGLPGAGFVEGQDAMIRAATAKARALMQAAEVDA
jgi:hypothetical protein